jgi:hypothetical protein
MAGTLAANIEAAIARREPDLVSLDPFVKSHSAEENNNTVIDEVAQILTDLGSKHNIGADAPHPGAGYARVAWSSNIRRILIKLRKARR